MHRSWLLAVTLLGCSLNSVGLGEEPGGLTDAPAAIDTTASSGDTDVLPSDGAAIFDAELEDSTIEATVDTSSPADTMTPDTKPDVVPEVDAGCKAPAPTANPCTEITHREELATGQVMDGKPDDFCDVPYVDFDNWKGIIRVPDMVPTPLQTTMRIRSAWSSYGMHLHLSIRDDKLQVAPDINLWQGDSAEIYIAGHDALTGVFDNLTKDVGAVQIIFAPAVGATPTRGVFFYPGGPRGGPTTDRWTFRTIATGYDFEIRLPWADLKAASMAAPTAGKRIGLTFAFNQKQDAGKAFAVHQVKSTAPIGGCTQPSCDDRFWCTPILNP